MGEILFAKIKLILRRHRDRRFLRSILSAFFTISRVLFYVFPLRVSFFLISFTRLFSRQISSFLASDFMVVASKRVLSFSGYKFSSILTANLPLQAAGILVRLGAFQEANELIAKGNRIFKSDEAILAIALDYFDLGEFKSAKEVSDLSPGFNLTLTNLMHLKALMELLVGSEELAADYLIEFANNSNAGWCPHQNIAARYPDKYLPLPEDKTTDKAD